MKKHSFGFRMRMFWGAFLAATALALFAVREPAYRLLRDQIGLLASDSVAFASSDDRAHYAEKHPDALRIAVVLGGPAAGGVSRTNQLAALARAFADVNARGGTGGRRLDAEFIDIGGSADRLQETAFRLAGDPSYFALVAALDAGQLVAVRPVLIRGNLVTLAPGVTSARAVPDGDRPFIFLPNASDADIASALAGAVAALGNVRLVLVQHGSLASTSLATELQTAFAEPQRSIATTLRLNATYGVPEDIVQLEAFRNNVSYRDSNVIVMANALQSREWHGERVDWICRDFQGRLFAAAPLAGRYAERISTVSILPEGHDSDDPLALLSARAVWILADACAKSKACSPAALSDALGSETLATPYGPFRFTPRRFESNPPVRVR